MTNEQQKAKELAEILIAFADENQLQFHIHGELVNGEPVWRDYQHLDIWELLANMADKYIIRIKPETKRVALTQPDLIDRELSRKTMWIRLIEGSTYQQIIAFGKEHLTVNGGTLYYGVLVDNYEFLDSTPCYKEVGCE